MNTETQKRFQLYVEIDGVRQPLYGPEGRDRAFVDAYPLGDKPGIVKAEWVVEDVKPKPIARSFLEEQRDDDPMRAALGFY